MNILPQAWIVLSSFILCIAFNLFMTFYNEKYRRVVFKNSTQEKVIYFVSIFVMGIVLTYSVQCSIHGSYAMPSCNVFAWMLTFLVLILFFWNVGSKIYLYIFKDDGARKKSSQEIEDIEEQYL